MYFDETEKSGLYSNCPIFSVCSNNLSTPDAINGIYAEQNSLEIGENATNFHACKGSNIILLADGYYVCSNISQLSKVAKLQGIKVLNVSMILLLKKVRKLIHMKN